MEKFDREWVEELELIYCRTMMYTCVGKDAGGRKNVHRKKIDLNHRAVSQ